ncbi:MAG: hypothetical protein PHE79_06075 [Eubacteriales bacterium]|nr:hypothetical protein [Eubacteriales bacterium]
MNKTKEQLANEERKLYFKQWRAKNKDKVQKHQKDFWMRKAEKKLKSNGGEN